MRSCLCLYICSTFVGNRGMNQSAIYSFKFPITLDGSCVFKGNMGGALSLLQSRVDVRGSAVFTDNIARMGGAMTLEDQSIVSTLSDIDINLDANNSFLNRSTTPDSPAQWL